MLFRSEWQLDSMLIKALNVEAVNAFAQQAIYPNNQVLKETFARDGMMEPKTATIIRP